MGLGKWAGGLIGGAIGGVPGAIIGARQGGKKRPPPNQMGLASGQGGLAKYPEWRSLYQSLQGGGNPQGMFQGVLGSFAQNPQDLRSFFEEAAPFIASSLFGSKGYQYTQDPNNWDQSMQAFGAGAGQIARSATRQTRSAQNQLATMGLGRSSAMAGVASGINQQAGGQMAGLYTNLFQQGVQNRLRAAQQAYGLDEAIISLALGHKPSRLPPSGPDPWMQLAGQALGGGLGALAGGMI